MEDTALYPMKFLPLYKNKVWGGNNIKTLGFDYSPLPNCGEMWVLSGVEGDESMVANGFLEGNNLNEVLEIYMGDLLGERNYLRFGDSFPLLFKLIDADDKLSIQVHPDDALARARGMENGKTEMWYVMQADEGAEIVDGFSADLTPHDYLQYLQHGHLERIVHREKPEVGDVFFIPAGRVHAIGKGLLLAEIQQASDCTYRIYDYNRPDSDGSLRPLHTDEALDALQFAATTDGKTRYDRKDNATVPVVDTAFFTTNIIHLTQGLRKDLSQLDSFIVYLCTEGTAAVKAMGHIVPFRAGECVLLPAVATEVELYCEQAATLLEVYIDPAKIADEELQHRGDKDWQVHYIGHDNPEDYLEEEVEASLFPFFDEVDDEEEEHSCHCGEHHHDGCDHDHCGCHHHDDGEECHCHHDEHLHDGSCHHRHE